MTSEAENPEEAADDRGAGEVLRDAIIAGLPEGWELDERDDANLAMAARQLEDLELLEAAIVEGGAMVPGSKGQLVVNPAIAEARQARLSFSRLLGAIQLPDETRAKAETAASQRARRASDIRWGNDRQAKLLRG